MDCATPEIRPPTPNRTSSSVSPLWRGRSKRSFSRAPSSTISRPRCIRSYHTIGSVSATSPMTGERSRCSRNMADQESCRRRTATRPTCSAPRAFRPPTHCWPGVRRRHALRARTCPPIRASLRQFDTATSCWRWTAVGDHSCRSLVGSRVIGDLSAASRVRGRLRRRSTSSGCARLGRLIGPFIETIARLYRERRRRHRVGRLTGITQLIGTTLDIRQILETLGDAIRLAVDFDTHGRDPLQARRQDYAFFGTVGEPPVPGVESIPTNEFSSRQR